MKYYYIRYSITMGVPPKTFETDCVSNKHPFDFISFFKSFSGVRKLIDWKEITLSEYEKGKIAFGIG